MVPISASRREGIDRLRQVIEQVLEAPQPAPVIRLMPTVFYNAASTLVNELAECGGDSSAAANCPSTLLKTASPLVQSYLVQRALLDQGGEVEKSLVGRDEAKSKLLESTRANLRGSVGDLNDLECENRYAWSDRMVAGVFSTASDIPHEVTDRLDGVLTHRVWGPVFFAAMMLLVFQFIYNWSGVPMGWIESVQQWCVGGVEQVVAPGCFAV